MFCSPGVATNSSLFHTHLLSNVPTQHNHNDAPQEQRQVMGYKLESTEHTEKKSNKDTSCELSPFEFENLG